MVTLRPIHWLAAAVLTWTAAWGGAPATAEDALRVESLEMLWTDDAVSGQADRRAGGGAVVAGDFAGQLGLDYDATSPTLLHSISWPALGAASQDLYLAAFDRAGGLQWALAAGSERDDFLDRLRTLPSGEIVAGGRQALYRASGHESPTPNDSASWTPMILGQGEPAEKVFPDDETFFLARYRPDGRLRWARALRAGTRPGGRMDFVSGSQEEIYFCGRHQGAVVFNWGDDNATTVTAGTMQVRNTFVGRYEADGTLAWSQFLAAGSSELFVDGTALTREADGRLLIAGTMYAYTAVTFGQGQSNAVQFRGEEGDGSAATFSFVAAYDADGRFLWIRKLSPQILIHWQGLVPAPAGGFYAAADFSGTVPLLDADGTTVATFANFFPGDRTDRKNILLARYDAAGNLVWARHLAGLFQGDEAIAYDLKTLPDGSALIGGAFDDQLVLDAGRPDQEEIRTGQSSLFLIQYRPDGTRAWVRYGSAPAGTALTLRTLAPDGEGGVYACGRVRSAAAPPSPPFPAGTDQPAGYLLRLTLDKEAATPGWMQYR